MNKSLITNLSAISTVIAGYLIPGDTGRIVFEIGIFATAGAITNWLAIHMLFERVPGLYGSGVIPSRFEEFKNGIQNLIMGQFFNKENIDKFLRDPKQDLSIDYKGLISGIDMDTVYKGLVDTVMESSFGGMLGMFGGPAALDSLKEPFAEKMQSILLDTVESDNFQSKIHDAEFCTQ